MLNLLTYTSRLDQLCLQPNGQEQLGEEFDEDRLEWWRYRGLEVNLKSGQELFETFEHLNDRVVVGTDALGSLPKRIINGRFRLEMSRT